jgi:hypothetical protein
MDEHKGKINLQVAKKIIADHYDVYTQKANHPCSRTVCSHYDLDAREYMSQADRPKPFEPRGAVDGIVADGTLIRKMGFVARYGSSCGRAFKVAPYIKKHRQYAVFGPYLFDRPSQPWTTFYSTNKTNITSASYRNVAREKRAVKHVVNSKRKTRGKRKMKGGKTVKRVHWAEPIAL